MSKTKIGSNRTKYPNILMFKKKYIQISKPIIQCKQDSLYIPADCCIYLLKRRRTRQFNIYFMYIY